MTTCFSPAADLRPITVDVLAAELVPPQYRSVDRWADEERWLSPESNAEAVAMHSPVPWTTDKVPYLREIMRDLTDPAVHHIVFVKARQLGGTEVINNWVGHCMREQPGPMAVIQPSLPLVKVWSLDRFDPMLRDSPALRGMVRSEGGRRLSEDTIERKSFGGGYIAAFSAGSAHQLQSRPLGKIAADERDKWAQDLKGQGDPLDIIIGGAATFWDWTVLEVSTPLDLHTSMIWASWRVSDQRLYEVPCPSCNGRQPLVWRDGEGEDETPEGGERYRLVCERDARGDLIPESARYQCAHCEALIEERWKPAMLAAGVWVPRYPGRSRRGYRLGGQYSPWMTWADMVARHQAALQSPAKLKTFVNLTVGLPFRETGAKIEAHFLQERAVSYGEGVEVPPGVGLVTAGVDVQGDRLELGLWGWGEREQSWVIRQQPIDGDPAKDEVWDDLAVLLQAPLRHQSGAQVRIASIAIDAGYQPDQVHKFCTRWHRPDRPVIPTIGRDGRGRPVLTAPTEQAKKWKRGRHSRYQSHILGDDAAKDLLAQRLRITEPGPGHVTFPDTLPSVFFDQLTAEELRTVYVKGRPTRRWVLPEDRRNEALDCAKGALAALYKLGPKVLARLGVLAEQLLTPGALVAPPPRARRIRSRGIE